MPSRTVRVSLALGLTLAVLTGCGEPHGAGTIDGERLPEAVLAERSDAARGTAAELASRADLEPPRTQILFGDLHVHTTFSADAFMMSLPILQGEGAHPIADACDFARYCSGIDFWSIADHAESLTPRRWQETIDSIRQCNALAGDPEHPDLVAFPGWEWSQVGRTPDDHYGHKNVVLREWEPGRVPTRPIHSGGFATQVMRQPQPLGQRIMLPLFDFGNRQIYFDLAEYLRELRSTPLCPEADSVHDLPADCSEGAPTPEGLFRKLDQWGFDALVIPHGTTWGIYTPPGSSWDKQLTPVQHDPARQRLVEVFSGHGNSEEYRSFREIEFAADGAAVCPAPHEGYEPCCWRAGEIIRARCESSDPAECERRVDEARANYLAAGAAGPLTVPGAEVEEWKDCGTCPDCFLPTFNYRPRSSVQYVMALSHFGDEADETQADDASPDEPLRFRFGFIASSDSHTARPGTGYKEYGRLEMTEARGPRDAKWAERATAGISQEPTPTSRRIELGAPDVPPFQVLDFERGASFFLTGGLVAVHSEGRSRDAIFEALGNRAVYGTSGDRILLWFDLLNGPDGALGMGSEVALAESPRFRVRAAGSFEQHPGCPEVSTRGLAPERLERLCRGECYHPSDTRRLITRIEVVRIRPQAETGEAVAPLIEDPWRTLACPPDPDGCVVEFDDPDFLAEGREVLYYVRAIQAPTPGVNAGLLRCQEGAGSTCTGVEPCYGDYRTPADDDCLAPFEARAWSSPIFVGSAAPAPAPAPTER